MTGLADKRVGIIGTGATAVQCIPHLGRSAKELFVFQRTPSAIDERNNHPIDPEWFAALEPGWQRKWMMNFTILQTMGFRTFVPLVAACPGCGRTTSTVFQELARDIQNWISTSMPEWKTRYPGVEGLKVAVMGCIVNGPGESKHADIGISLPGTGETPAAPVFIDGQKAVTLRGAAIAADFKLLVSDYIEKRFGLPR